MFERIPDVGGPIRRQSSNNLAHAVASIIRDNDGIKCPHGCNGCAWRIYGLVSHLMTVHGYSEKSAWKLAEKA